MNMIGDNIQFNVYAIIVLFILLIKESLWKDLIIMTI